MSQNLNSHNDLLESPSWLGGTPGIVFTCCALWCLHKWGRLLQAHSKHTLYFRFFATDSALLRQLVLNGEEDCRGAITKQHMSCRGNMLQRTRQMQSGPQRICITGGSRPYLCTAQSPNPSFGRYTSLCFQVSLWRTYTNCQVAYSICTDCE